MSPDAQRDYTIYGGERMSYYLDLKNGHGVTFYPDDGCSAGGPSCLECRLPQCVLDGQRERPRQATQARNAAIRRDYEAMRSRGRQYVYLNVLAERYGIGMSTLKTALRATRS